MTKIRPTEWEQLIADYHRDNKLIADQKFKWLPIEELIGSEDAEDKGRTIQQGQVLQFRRWKSEFT
ncbi:MAG: hypothetical protein NVS1B10_06400 [Candidatus Saccharimonadales bacterium]